MGCECQQSQTRGFSIGVFISSCLSSPLPLKQKLCCGWKLSWAGPSCLWALLGAHPSFSFPALLWGCPHCGTPCSADPVPCCRCNVAVNQLQLKAHQQICLFFPPHLPMSLPASLRIPKSLCVFSHVRAQPAWAGGGDIPEPKSSLGCAAPLLKPTKALSQGRSTHLSPCFARNTADS